MRTFSRWWSVGVGAMDASTGILLLACPAWVLSILQIEGVGEGSLIFLRWIGVFVGGVGIGYAQVFRGWRQAETVWRMTAWIRGGVAAFVTMSIVTGSLSPAWAAVAITDAVVAFIQAWGLTKGWWRE